LFQQEPRSFQDTRQIVIEVFFMHDAVTSANVSGCSLS